MFGNTNRAVIRLISITEVSIINQIINQSVNQMRISTTLFFTLFLFLFTYFSSAAQEKFTVSGTISDKESNETLIGVNLFIRELKTGITTNEYGFYSISLPAGDYTLEVSYVG